MHRLLVRGLVVSLVGAGTFVVPAPAPADPGPAPTPTPTPTAGSGSIVVHAVGDRDLASGAPVPLPGARIGAFPDPSLTAAVGACTTDTAGTCTISGLAAGTYHVAPVAAPVGSTFSPIEAVMTSLGGRQRYTEAVVVDEEANPVTRRFVFARANPDFPARCGVRVTLLYDVSGSISENEAADMQRASLEFVDALGGTSSAIAVASFATDAPAAGNANLALTSVAEGSGIAAVKAAIRALSRPDGEGGFTNWDAAFRSVVGPSDIVVMFTDGNPTVHGVPASYPPVVTGFDQLDAGVLSANAVKAAGTRVLAVGVGDLGALSRDNLALVSGPVADVDYAITTFADVRSVFRRLADALCSRSSTPPPPAPFAPEPVPLVPRFTG